MRRDRSRSLVLTVVSLLFVMGLARIAPAQCYDHPCPEENDGDVDDDDLALKQANPGAYVGPGVRRRAGAKASPSPADAGVGCLRIVVSCIRFCDHNIW